MDCYPCFTLLIAFTYSDESSITRKQFFRLLSEQKDEPKSAVFSPEVMLFGAVSSPMHLVLFSTPNI